MNKIIISLFILGLTFGSGPCLASCGPLLISYVAGTKKNILKSLGAYILFSLTRISVYIVFSLLLFFFGRFATQRIWGSFSGYIVTLGGVFIFLIGLLMVFGKRLEFKTWNFLQNYILERDKKSIVILGLVTGILPCAPLIVALSYIALISKFWLQSLFYILSFGLGTLISPLILFTLFAGFLGRWLENKKYYRIFSSLCGIMIMFLGLQLIRGAF